MQSSFIQCLDSLLVLMRSVFFYCFNISMLVASIGNSNCCLLFNFPYFKSQSLAGFKAAFFFFFKPTSTSMLNTLLCLFSLPAVVFPTNWHASVYFDSQIINKLILVHTLTTSASWHHILNIRWYPRVKTVKLLNILMLSKHQVMENIILICIYYIPYIWK